MSLISYEKTKWASFDKIKNRQHTYSHIRGQKKMEANTTLERGPCLTKKNPMNVMKKKMASENFFMIN